MNDFNIVGLIIKGGVIHYNLTCRTWGGSELFGAKCDSGDRIARSGKHRNGISMGDMA